MHWGTRILALVMGVAALAAFSPGAAPPPALEAAAAAVVPSGFQESVAFSGLTNPTVVRFASDGRVFIAEKSGLIKVFDNLADTTPTTFADLRTNVYNFWDRGLLGMALDPNFPSTPYVYVLYTYDHMLGDPAPPPRWGTPGATSDGCPSPPGPTSDGCVVSARLSRLQASGNVMTGSEQVLVEGWCQQYPSHSIGTVEFGPEGALYASGGDGASFTFTDYGQDGSPLNPCGDPPGGVGATLAPPTAEGGSLRSQDLRTTSDPVGLDGSIIRVDPATGAALSTNPLIGSVDPNAKRIIAYGLRNPFRFTFRPGTSELWIGDVGQSDWEEIDRILSPTDSTVENFGWPCYEGNPHQSGFDSANLNICENLYAQPSADMKPYFAYAHSNKVVTGESCPTGSSSISGLSFEFAPSGSTFASEYQGALFFADYSRDCIWVMEKNGNPVPSPGSIKTFVVNAANPVNLEFGPDGNLYYVDFDGGTIRKIAPNGPEPPSNCSAYQAQYFSNITLSGSAVLTRCESAINYDWGVGSPDASVPTDDFSARWTGSFDFLAGDTTFTATADDGIRVWVDGTLVIDAWVNQAPTTYTATRTLSSGSHQVRVEYYDSGGGAVAKVSWATAGSSAPQITATTPAPGASGVALDVSPTATFSEAMDPATLTTSTFTLVKQGTSTPIGASVSYANLLATLDPSGSLASGTTYTATVKGGSSGAKDAGGTPLASDVSWTFATISGSNQPPVPVIDTPPATLTWKVGDQISFSGHASDSEQGTLPASALSWTLLIQHCPSNCHTHTIQTWTGVSSGSVGAPDHEYPSYLELRLTATDAAGSAVTTSVALQPQTVVLSFASSPAGLQLTVNGVSSTTTFTRTIIVGSTNSLSATTPQVLNGTTYEFSSWSDGGAQTHNITSPTDATYTATYVIAPPRNTALPTISGTARVGRTLTGNNGTWSGSQPMSFAYQWLRCTTNSIASCVAITGATAKTYVPTSADIDFRMRVRVIATNAGGSGTATSAATARVRA